LVCFFDQPMPSTRIFQTIVWSFVQMLASYTSAMMSPLRGS